MNEIIKFENTDIMNAYQKSENIVIDVQNIIETSQRQAYHAVDTILSQRNWLIGCRIAEEEMDGAERAEYGTNIIKQLSKELTAKYGRGYDRSNLYHCLRFYKEFPEMVDTVCRQSNICLSWSHYRVLLQVSDVTARKWYEKEDYFIDLVFYNYILKCFVLIDLKTDKISHQDVGQMDMYIRMYDELKKGADDNPTLGIVLCTETDEDIARYSVLHGNEQLFASKYIF